jgi:N-acetylmuramoyl-L-alanine amidase
MGLVLATAPSAAQEGPRQLETGLQPHGTLRWSRESTPVLLVSTRRGDGWLHLARRYSGTSDTASRIKRANAPLEHPMRDRRVRIPVELLRADLRVAAAQRIFPADRRVSGGYEHWVLDPFGRGEESWAWLADLFTGRRSNAEILQRANRAPGGGSPDRGTVVLIPEQQLIDAFAGLTPVATPVPTATPSPTPRPRISPTPNRSTAVPRVEGATLPAVSPGSQNGVLSYGVDSEGEYAIYRLRRGEALYSAVVVRFTGQLRAKAVNATAAEIAVRSGIADVTDIPVGYAIKIPLSMLLPIHLPVDHPRRLAWLAERKELAGFLEEVEATDLSGVHVILDAGHGGQDSGASVNGLWEATYAYDIACRIKEKLERHTEATVYMMRGDAKLGFSIPRRGRLEQHRDQFLFSTPRYNLTDSNTGVNLRWYMGNDVVRRLERQGVSRSRTVFISIHADSLHPSVRGAMAYVPARQLRKSSHTAKRRSLKAFQEYRANPTVKLSDDFKAKAEASSRHLAEQMIAHIRINGLEVHPYEPVRGRIRRGRRTPFVPAVLHYSLAQNAVLVECCNMANTADRNLLVDQAWREKFALAVVEGVADAFSAR